jgi:hypothetical protein
MSGMNVVSCSEERWRLQRATQGRAHVFIILYEIRLWGNRCHPFWVTKGTDANTRKDMRPYTRRAESTSRYAADVRAGNAGLVAPLEGIEPPSRP